MFLKIFKRKKSTSKCSMQNVTPRIFCLWEHNWWGNSINWQDWEKRSLYGHMTPKPKIGDILEAKMESGRIGLFEFTEVRECIDPHDMFFAKVKDLRYK